jgi:hypothetical protein
MLPVTHRALTRVALGARPYAAKRLERANGRFDDRQRPLRSTLIVNSGSMADSRGSATSSPSHEW